MARNIGEGSVDDEAYRAAAGAVLLEYRASSKNLKLRCLRSEAIGENDDGIYLLQISRFADPDWTWEGARAYRSPNQPSPMDHYSWSGEVVEVDHVNSAIFVRIESGEPAPCMGDFFVAPYEFLAHLNRLFNGDLAAGYQGALSQGLAGASGTLSPVRVPVSESGQQFAQVWGSSWGYIWGPPGCGKTYSIGQEVAGILADPSERILIVSTTNKATDEVALSVGKALRSKGVPVGRELVSRIGAGADVERFRAEGLEELVAGGEAWAHRRLSQLLREHSAAVEPSIRAQLWVQIQAIRQALSTGRSGVADTGSRVVVATTFAAVRYLTSAESLARVVSHRSSFTTVVVDEAGLVSRVAVAALSCWAARRIVLVGDQRQLSPISRISRLLPRSVARWIAASGLSHVTSGTSNMQLLTVQHRMHPDIRNAVSSYQYEGLLTDAPALGARPTSLNESLSAGPRAVWYVLDADDGGEPSHIRAERGPANKSWIRQRSREIVKRLLTAHPSLATVEVLFITPFVAQARLMSQLFGELGLTSWRASTVHRQQGAEAEVVVFDTVNAGSTGWSHDEWRRLISVGISRARERLFVLASRAEMLQSYLAPLSTLLRPLALAGLGGQLKWAIVPRSAAAPQAALEGRTPDALGTQIDARRRLRPILSAEQQRLCEYSLDGKPRLVRGVAGSGKTAVLAHWVARQLAVADGPDPIWVVYANAALADLLRDAIENAWLGLGQDCSVPWSRVEIVHILQLLEALEAEFGIPSAVGDAAYDFEERSALLMTRTPPPRCAALFLDEAQDFGETTLRLLAELVERRIDDDARSRSINIFYDNAQNVYGRGTPKWSDLGLDMRGRSTVMKESFRSTRPIAEFALNVLYRLSPPDADPDHRELVERHLIEEERRNDRPWWRVRFNQVDGPPPDFRRFPDRASETDALSSQVRQWIERDGIRPRDIRIVLNDPYLRRKVAGGLSATLRPLGVRVEEQRRKGFAVQDDLLIVTTAHSLKGHEAEVIAVPAADKFAAKTDAGYRSMLPKVLYVALTRARSVLYVSSIIRSAGSPGASIVDALQASLEDLRSVPAEVAASSDRELETELLDLIDDVHRDWARKLFRAATPRSGPVCRGDGSIVLEPLFWVELSSGKYAYVREAPSEFVTQELSDAGFVPLVPGAALPEIPTPSN